MSIRAVFIDIDNTLLDFDAYVVETMKNGFAEFGVGPYEPYMEEVFHRENSKLWRRIEDRTLTFEELVKIRWNTVFAALGIDCDGPAFETYFRAALNESAIPVAGAKDLLEFLQGRALVCAASNGPYNQQVHRLALAGFDRYFDHMFISERLGVSKPAPAFFEQAFQILNEGETVQGRPAITPGECLMVGDSLTADIAGGTASGMQNCYYRRDPSAPKADAPCVTVDDLNAIPAAFEGLWN